MFQRIVPTILIVFLATTAACSQPPPANPQRPPSQMTAVFAPGQDQHISVTVKSVELVHSGESSVNDPNEFRLIIIGTNGEGESSGAFFPGDEAYALNVGQRFSQHCIISFDEKTAGDEYYLLLIGVDEDEVSFAEDLGYELGINVLAAGFMKGAKALAAAGGVTVSGGAALVAGLVVDQALTFAGDHVVDYFQQKDVIGQQMLVLRRSGNWGVDQDLSFLTQDGGMRVTMHISRVTAANGSQSVQIQPAQPNKQAVQPTQPPARVQPTSPPPPTQPPASPIRALNLVNPARGSIVMTLTDGATVDLGRIGADFLDVIADASPSQVGSVTFKLDGGSFCMNDSNRCIENVAPYVMGGDQGGDLYGNWSWAGLAGGTHTISARACTGPHGSGDCWDPVTVSIYVTR